MYLQGGMKQAVVATSTPSNEEGAYHGEAACGIPITPQVQHEYGHSFVGDVRTRRPSTNGRWSTGLFGCFTAPSTCFLTFLCPCVIFGRIAEIVDRGQTSCIMSALLYEGMRVMTGCACLYSAYFRAKLRAQYHLPEIPAADWAVHFLCEPCALIQEYRELQRQGYIMTIGWQGNLEMQRPAPTVPPVVAPPMMR